MTTQLGMLVLTALLLASAHPANASLPREDTTSQAGTLTGYYGCTHFPTGGTVCEDDGYGPIEQRPRKK